MRVKNSVKNITFSMISNLLTILIGFIVQAIFIKTLNTEYLGINGLFKNIISMLSIAELGIGSAIIYHLYKPVAENDKEKIKSLLKLYKKCYITIAFTVLFISLILIPFLGKIVGNIDIKESIIIIYMLFVIDSVCSYLISYKRSILYVHQKNYYINIIHIICYIVLNILQIIILIKFKNYYLYLLLKIIFNLIENLIISRYASHKYKYINEKNIKPLDEDIIKDIKQKVKSLFIHKIGGFFVKGTDNIIISMFIGIKTVGLYSNYSLIISALTSLIGQVFSPLIASVGNLLVTSNIEKKYEVYRKIEFFNFWITCFCSICLLVIIKPFIIIWIGEEYLLSDFTVIVLVINFYFQILRYRTNIFKEAAGIFYEDRFIPIVESIINIVSSLVLVKLIGLPGVFIGTILSNFLLIFYSHPKYVYEKIFKRKYITYLISTIKYFITFVSIAIVVYALSSIIVINDIYIDFIYKTALTTILTNLLLILLFRKTEEFKYFIKLICKKLGVKNEK